MWDSEWKPMEKNKARMDELRATVLIGDTDTIGIYIYDDWTMAHIWIECRIPNNV